MTEMTALDRYCAIVAGLKQKNVPPGGEAMIEPISAALADGFGPIIDLGCNTGWVARQLARRFPDRTLIGIDVDQNMIDAAREIARLEGSPVRFECVDGARIDTRHGGAGAVVCAGSAAFFREPDKVYRRAAQCLVDGGTFVDGHYLYDSDVPPSLREQEREMFGLNWMPKGIAEIIATYEAAGLIVDSLRRYPRWMVRSSASANYARALMLADERIRPLVEGMIDRRALIETLCRFRYAYLITARKGRPMPKPGSMVTDLPRVLATLDLFARSGPVQPMARLRAMTPYAFLAYVGDPDAAPGGGRAVARQAALLGEFGAGPQARILDIGCFTGLSSIVLASRFERVTGIDIVPDFLATARQVAADLGSPASFVRADGAATGLDANSIDAVTMTATLAYTPKPRAILAECRRILKQGGLLTEFLYHHFETGPVEKAAIRRSVGPDVALGPLSQKIADFEAEGFRLVAIERAPTGNADEPVRDVVAAHVVAREAARDPEKSASDLKEFRQLFDLYAGRMASNRESPVAFLCVFQKEPTAQSG